MMKVHLQDYDWNIKKERKGFEYCTIIYVQYNIYTFDIGY